MSGWPGHPYSYALYYYMHFISQECSQNTNPNFCLVGPCYDDIKD